VTKFIYLSGPYGRKEELHKIAKRIMAVTNWVVFSSWLKEDKQYKTMEDFSKPDSAVVAIRDLDEVGSVDALAKFEDTDTAKTHGGKHQEMGAALALGKDVIIVGNREGVFDYLPSVVQVNNYHELINWLLEHES
jgi:nucleoside 2-deoxyribosyltransferase